MKILILQNLVNIQKTDIPYGKQIPLIMQYSNVLVLMAYALVKHGINSLKNLYHRQAIHRQKIQTLKYILKMVKAVYFVNYGFL